MVRNDDGLLFAVPSPPPKNALLTSCTTDDMDDLLCRTFDVELEKDASRTEHTCCDLLFILSADNLMEAIEVVAAPMSHSGINDCRMSGDSSGLLSAELRVAFTRKL